jgi:hypothetical protein
VTEGTGMGAWGSVKACECKIVKESLEQSLNLNYKDTVEADLKIPLTVN